MLSIFRKKNTEKMDASGLYCDMHSHLIPGIDDGAKDMQTSLQLIKGMVNLGYKKIITTPHIMWDMYKNTHEIIPSGAEELKKELKQHNVEVEFHTAAEYFMDDHFDELLRTDTPLLILKDNIVLVEFSFVSQPLNLKEKLFKLQIKGYQPVIAHPERYLYLGADKTWYEDMKDIGCWFQMNILSPGGYYGRATAELAHYLMKKKYINLIGTDLHNNGHLAALTASSFLMDTINKLLDDGIIKNPSL